MLPIEFELTNPKLISVNEQYMHPVRKTKTGRYSSYVCKSPYLKEVQEYYKDKLSVLITDDDIIKLKETSEDVVIPKGISLYIRIGFPKNQLHKHDISNFIKAIEDCISSRIGIDDAYNYNVSIKKTVSKDDNWKMFVRINNYYLEEF